MDRSLHLLEGGPWERRVCLVRAQVQGKSWRRRPQGRNIVISSKRERTFLNPLQTGNASRVLHWVFWCHYRLRSTPFFYWFLGNLKEGWFQCVPNPKESMLAYLFAQGIFARKISKVYHQYLCFPLESRNENPRQTKRKFGFNRSTCIWDKVDWRFAIFNRRHHHWGRALPHRPKPAVGARKVY